MLESNIILPQSAQVKYLFKCGNFLPPSTNLFIIVGRNVNVRELLLNHRISSGTSFTDLLPNPLPFKIPITRQSHINMFPTVFELGYGEYFESIDLWLEHPLISLTSEQAVVILDGMWQCLFKLVAMTNILLDQHDASSNAKCRPDFTAMLNGVLVMKGEAKAFLTDMIVSRDDLIKKFHPSAYKLFPSGCSSIPAVLTCNEQIQLYSLSYFHRKYSMGLVKTYNVGVMPGRVEFISDIFRILLWVLSQANPVERFHLPPGVRTKTRNAHHITLLAEGIFKEFDRTKLSRIDMDAIRTIYSLKLPNVEWGTVNGKSITITRVGSTLVDAMRVRHLSREDVFDQVSRGVAQLHANGLAHCDICVDNIFVDDLEDGGHVFLGDLEYCCGKDSKPRSDTRRADGRATTAEELDNIQLAKLKDELASL